MQRLRDELSWRIGGPQGSGIDRLANVFGYACAASGLNVFGHREYHSNIIGRHSYFNFSISTEPLDSYRESPDIMVTFDPESLCRHLFTIADGGHLLYAAEDADVRLDSLPFLDARILESMSANVALDGKPINIAALLEQARDRGIQLCPIPYSEILAVLADACNLSRRQAGRAINTLAVAVSAALIGLSDELLIATLKNVFANDEHVLKLNTLAVIKAYDFVANHSDGSSKLTWLHKQRVQQDTLYINGSQSVALGKLAAGMAFQTYYPISPASDESVYLETQDPVPLRNGGHAAPLVLQVEDELAAITMACGAALTGARSSTSTSGPGFCLMAEGLGWAGMNEVPVVVSLYQRGGPSTGMPTRTEQGDLQFAIHAGHGEFPRLVLASGDIEECFYDTMKAFDYAEHYQLPVIHILDKSLASISQTINRFRYEDRLIDRGERFANNNPGSIPIERFAQTPSGISPRPLLGQDDAQHWLTGAEHDGYGQVSEDPVVRKQMMEKRMLKLQQILADLTFEEKLSMYGNEAARFTVLTWGSTKGAVWDAVKRMAQQDIEVRAIQLRLLWPFPVRELASLLAKASPLVVVECNYSGQLNALLNEQVGRDADHLLLKYSGRPMSGDAVFKALKEVYAGNGTSRKVLDNPNE